MTSITAFLSGLLFGIGLLLSGMTNPSKVQAFLDLGGDWDPSLALVMVGAIAMAAPAFVLARVRANTWFGAPLKLPPSTRITGRLVAGSVVFGVGWGLAGFCPGPALTMLLSGEGQVLLFVGAMVAGMLLTPHLSN
jgi:uncharacterized protein